MTRHTYLGERAAVRDLLAVCRVLVNPADWLAWERLRHLRPRSMGAKALAALRARIDALGVCCDAVVLRRVYHHLSDPPATERRSPACAAPRRRARDHRLSADASLDLAMGAERCPLSTPAHEFAPGF
jgi:hypothetical protein